MNALLALRTAASTAIERHLVHCHQPLVGHHALPVGSLFGIRQQLRFKHSSRQKKRMANHPARLRVLDRLQSAEPARAPKPTPAEPVPPTPTYPKVFEPELLMNGWSAPPADQSKLTQKYPFQIPRTKNKPNDAAGFLPVYTYFRKDGTKVTTRIKKVTGNVDAFVKELHASLPSVRPDDIQHRVGGTIELKGNHVRTVKFWLASLGF